MNFSEEIQLSILNFKESKRNYCKSTPNIKTIKNIEEKLVSNGEQHLLITYDIDGILGVSSMEFVDTIVFANITILYTKAKPKINYLFLEHKNVSFDIKSCHFFNFGRIYIYNAFYINIFLINQKSAIQKIDLNDIFSSYNKKISNMQINILKYNHLQNKYEGNIPKENLKYFKTALLEKNEDFFLYYELLGSKNILSATNIFNLLSKAQKFINIQNENFMVDFCINYTDLKGNIIYPKLTFLEDLGEKANFFQFFSYRCPCINRNKSKYITPKSKFLSYNISKINFYNSIQDTFDEISMSKFYPMATKSLLNDLFNDDFTFTSFNKAIKSYEEIKSRILKILHQKNSGLQYRFEFRLQSTTILDLSCDFENIVSNSSFIFYEKNNFLNNILKNFSTILDLMQFENKGITNLGKILLLEVLLVSCFLRGDCFKLPFTTSIQRKEFKDLWEVDIYSIEKENILNLFVNSEFIVSFEKFSSSVSFLKQEQIEIIHYILGFFPLLNCKEMLLEEIKNLILYNKTNIIKGAKKIFINPIDFFLSKYYPSLEHCDPIKQLIDAYINYHGYDIFENIFHDSNIFYFETKNLLVSFNDELMFEEIRNKNEENILNFLKRIPKQRKHWSEDELNELYFVKNLYNYSDLLIKIDDIYSNLSFSFHLKKTFIAFKKKFYKIDANKTKTFKIYSLNSRFEYLENLMNIKLTRNFKKEYIILVHQDILKLGLLEKK